MQAPPAPLNPHPFGLSLSKPGRPVANSRLAGSGSRGYLQPINIQAFLASSA